jgi:hypothetical protein
MSDQSKHRLSFSAAYRWQFALDVLVRTFLVLAVLAMVDYLGTLFFHRFYLSHQRHAGLAPITQGVLHSLTNQISVTLFYDRTDDFYHDITALLDEYKAVNPKLSYRTVDYARDPGDAEKVKQKYHLDSPEDKNLIIFDCNGSFKVCTGEQLLKYDYTAPDKNAKKDVKFEIAPVAFRAEQLFTAMILALESPHPLKAYFLQGHGEPSLTDGGSFGYQTFGGVLAQNYIATYNLQLSAGSSIPMDCDLLVIAAPPTGNASALSDSELKAIEQYLNEGGRLLALFSCQWIESPSGLEPILQRWGVNVVPDEVRDVDNTISGQDLKATKFSKHEIVNSLSQSSLQMILPRPVENITGQNPPPGAPKVDELAFSSPKSTMVGDSTASPRSYPLMAAIEQKPVAGAVGLRGNTRIVVTGDSIFLINHYIQGAANRDFLQNAINWLTERPLLLQGISDRPLTEFRLNLSWSQERQVDWLLLAALPGAVLLLGGIVWFVRRK